jgi:hypothetical protein
MRMSIYSLLLYLSAPSFAVAAPSTFPVAKPSVFVGDWTSPVKRALPAESGPEQIIARQCCVRYQSPGLEEDHVVQMLLSVDLGQVWVGEPAAQYAVAGGKIWGAFIDYGRLLLQPSEPYGFDAGILESNLTTILSGYLGDFPTPRQFTALAGKLRYEDYVGLNTVESCESVSGRTSLYLAGASASPQGITLQICSTNSPRIGVTNRPLRIALTLGNQMQVNGLTINGTGYPVLFDNAISVPTTHTWYSLNTNLLPSLTGGEPGLYASRWYWSEETEASPTRILDMYRAAVVASSGAFWIGPTACTCVVLNGQIAGVRVNNGSRQIELFKSKQTPLPLREGTAAEFQRQTQQFDRELLDRQFAYAPDRTVDVPRLFANEPNLPASFTMRFGRIYLKNGNLVVKLLTSNPRNAEVVLTPEFEVVSARLLPNETPDATNE